MKKTPDPFPGALRSRSCARARRQNPIVVDRVGRVHYVADMDYSHLITIEPDKRSGQPRIRGLRITVQDVLEYLASGMSMDEILADFPDLTTEDIRACLAYAAERERRLRVIPAA
jgi:uncharacterized protein (DUF433 family)